jgi:hypothetical protein
MVAVAVAEAAVTVSAAAVAVSATERAGAAVVALRVAAVVGSSVPATHSAAASAGLKIFGPLSSTSSSSESILPSS